LQQICNKRDAKMRPIPSNPSLLEIAISACATLSDDGTRQNCIFDVMATGDTIWAVNPGYTDPLEPPGEQLYGKRIK
jgi:hypothetical protein